jgi:hypothetical protein
VKCLAFCCQDNRSKSRRGTVNFICKASRDSETGSNLATRMMNRTSSLVGCILTASFSSGLSACKRGISDADQSARKRVIPLPRSKSTRACLRSLCSCVYSFHAITSPESDWSGHSKSGSFWSLSQRFSAATKKPALCPRLWAAASNDLQALSRACLLVRIWSSSI